MCIPVNREFRCVLNHIFSLLFFSVAPRSGDGLKLGRPETEREGGGQSASKRACIAERTAGVSPYSCSSQAFTLG